MATSIITVKDVQEKSRDGSTWLEIIDQSNRTHRIFRRVQDNEGNWHDLSSKYEMLRNSVNKPLKLITEQKGRFTNVIDVDSVEIPEQEPEELPLNMPMNVPSAAKDTPQECRLRTFAAAYAKDLAVAGKIPPESMLAWAEAIYRYIRGETAVRATDLQAMAERPGTTRAVRATPVRRPLAAQTSSDMDWAD